jgi:hypothetical protein
MEDEDSAATRSRWDSQIKLEFKEVSSASRQRVKVFQSPADCGASTALYERIWRSVRGIGNLDREATALHANELETRPTQRDRVFYDRRVHALIQRR